VKVNPADLDHRIAHHLMVSIITPRPIAWVSTVSQDGVFNLAPFSCFMSICLHPNLVCLSVGTHRDGSSKDTVRNIDFSRDFVINVVDENLAEAMNTTSAFFPASVSEFNEAGLTPLKSDMVKSPRLAESPVSMECKLWQIQHFGDAPYVASLIIGEVLLVHIKDEIWIDNEIPNSRLKAVGRLGGDLYLKTTAEFEMKRPESGYA
jgi:flavin reductase (DIM6/NTAB) family NADH-FMN oxidoreductase RutF